MCNQAPVWERKETEAGVKEEARFENWSGGRVHSRDGERDWDSTRARRRDEVFGEEPIIVVSHFYLDS